MRSPAGVVCAAALAGGGHAACTLAAGRGGAGCFGGLAGAGLAGDRAAGRGFTGDLRRTGGFFAGVFAVFAVCFRGASLVAGGGRRFTLVLTFVFFVVAMCHPQSHRRTDGKPAVTRLGMPERSCYPGRRILEGSPRPRDRRGVR